MAKFKMLNEEQLASLICIANNIAPIDQDDGSSNWWMFAADAKKMLATVDLERYEMIAKPSSSGDSQP